MTVSGAQNRQGATKDLCGLRRHGLRQSRSRPDCPGLYDSHGSRLTFPPGRIERCSHRIGQSRQGLQSPLHVRFGEDVFHPDSLSHRDCNVKVFSPDA